MSAKRFTFKILHEQEKRASLGKVLTRGRIPIPHRYDHPFILMEETGQKIPVQQQLKLGATLKPRVAYIPPRRRPRYLPLPAEKVTLRLPSNDDNVNFFNNESNTSMLTSLLKDGSFGDMGLVLGALGHYNKVSSAVNDAEYGLDDDETNMASALETFGSDLMNSNPELQETPVLNLGPAARATALEDEDEEEEEEEAIPKLEKETASPDMSVKSEIGTDSTDVEVPQESTTETVSSEVSPEPVQEQKRKKIGVSLGDLRTVIDASRNAFKDAIELNLTASQDSKEQLQQIIYALFQSAINLGKITNAVYQKTMLAAREHNLNLEDVRASKPGTLMVESLALFISIVKAIQDIYSGILSPKTLQSDVSPVDIRRQYEEQGRTAASLEDLPRRLEMGFTTLSELIPKTK